METNSKALEASKAVNALLGLGSEDQEALLEVLEDYFTSSTVLRVKMTAFLMKMMK